MVWIVGAGSVLLVVLAAIGLFDVVKNRHTMDTWQMVVWVAVIVLVPTVGLIAYLFWRLARSEAMADSMDLTAERGSGRTIIPPGGR